jgi:hypothetical protein
MNRLHTKDPGRRASRIPQWLREEWVWDGLLGVLVTCSVVYTVLSSGGGQIV